jgi:two-component system, OmpR family, phosphate regulon sensor histidine kinase PhoR
MKGKRFFTYILFTLLIISSIAGIRSFVTEKRHFQLAVGSRIETLRTLGEFIAADLHPAVFTNTEAAQEFCSQFTESGNLQVSLLTAGGNFIGDSRESPAHLGSKGDSFEFQDALSTGFGSTLKFNPLFSQQTVYVDLAVLDTDGKPAGVLEINMPITYIRLHIRRLVIRGYILTVFLLSIASFTGYFLIRSFYKPINALREAASYYGNENFSFDPRVEKPEELRVLSTTMRRMAASLRTRIHVIERQRNELEMILSSMIEAVIVLDSHLVIRKMNKMGLTLLNMKREEVEDRSLIEIFRNTELYEFATQILLDSGPRETSITVYTNAPALALEGEPFGEKGRQLFLQVHGSSMQGGPGSDTDAAVLLVLHDITKMKSLENMRKDFVANVSHELKTPITSIKGFVETLLAGAVKNPSKSVHFLEIIEKHTTRLNSIIDDLLSLSRLEQFENNQLEFKRFSLSSIIGRAVAACTAKATQNGITVSVDAPEEITAEINPQLIEQALINLIDNAVKYSENGSSITITLSKRNSSVNIAIADNGCGIPSHALNRVFERFYRVDQARSRDLGGTGLGLAIVKHIAFAHNGEAFVQSELGKGSTFFLVLPEEQQQLHSEN